MCGISAIISAGGADHIQSKICDMTTMVRHRGPDDEGYVFFDPGAYQFHIFGGSDTPEDCFGSEYRYCPKSKVTQFLPGIEPIVAFGHRRLSILDISPAGHQFEILLDKYSSFYLKEMLNRSIQVPKQINRQTR